MAVHPNDQQSWWTRHVLAAGALAFAIWAVAPVAQAQEPKTIKVVIIAGAQFAPLFLGEEKGYFTKEGLKLDIVLGQDGAVYMPGVLSGDYHVAALNGINLFLAQEKGLPLQIFASGSSGGSNPDSHMSGFIVKGDSPYKTAKDLEGKTVALAALKSLPEVIAKAGLEKAGADIKKVKFVEVPFPQMVAAVSQGRVDAAWALEPFVTIGTNNGLRYIGGSYASVVKDSPVAIWGASANWLKANKDTAAAFNRAIVASNEYASANPQEARRILGSWLKMQAAVAEKMELPTWPSQISESGIMGLAELSRKYGVTDKPFDLKAAYFKP
jgi:NitT/TauT family transport system substrate-binding protein